MPRVTLCLVREAELLSTEPVGGMKAVAYLVERMEKASARR